MPLNIKDPETEQLAAEVARLTGESKTGAIRVALRERRARLLLAQGADPRDGRLRRMLEERAWPRLPDGVRGATMSRTEEEAILGFGPEGA
jgi:antitoxin VapB